ncbi:MAG: hypothetical protein Q9227_000204 [Pyrenula ochraceoflavens]
MQYVRNLGSSVSNTWNSINPATLSGAIDVIVIEQEDGTLACSPFHVRFGKFSLLRPYEKKVEFRVNGVKQNYAMKLGEGGEAFFIFETTENIPKALQTSPLVSPANSPPFQSTDDVSTKALQEPTYLDIESNGRPPLSTTASSPTVPPTLVDSSHSRRDQALLDDTLLMPESFSWPGSKIPPTLERSASEEMLPVSAKAQLHDLEEDHFMRTAVPVTSDASRLENPEAKRPTSPPSVSFEGALDRAKTLSNKLSSSNIRSKVNESGDLMLDMTGYKSSEDDALRAELIARKILSEELEGSYDIGSLIGTDEQGNLWIYSSEEAKEAANRKSTLQGLSSTAILADDAVSDPGYHSDTDRSVSSGMTEQKHTRSQSESSHQMPTHIRAGLEPSKNYAKTLRLTSDQLRELQLKPGVNHMSFTVNKATCSASMFYWKQDIPVVISDIDGTITKSDALGHVLNMIGRDWTHVGVAKLYTDIAANGYHVIYLTSRSVGQADTTRAYLNGIVQEGHRLPKGPVIMSPDRTIAALRREVYLRKPEVFKMACLRDILALYPGRTNPFYAGFGNRLTDALSYRTVNIPQSRIFTINSNAEVSLDLLSLGKYKSSYVSMRELVDQFFPPISLLVKEGGEDFTDFNYWRDKPNEAELSDSDFEDDNAPEDDDEEEEEVNELGESYLSRDSMDQSILGESMHERLDLNDRHQIIEEEEDILSDYLPSDGRPSIDTGRPLSPIISNESVEPERGIDAVVKGTTPKR